MRVAARASAKLKNPRLVSALDSWKEQARLYGVLNDDRENGTGAHSGFGKLAQCVTRCLGGGTLQTPPSASLSKKEQLPQWMLEDDMAV